MSRRAAKMPTGGVHTVRYGWDRLLPYSPPWVAWLVLPALAALARHFSTSSVSAAMLAAIGIAASVSVLTWFTWHVFRARGHSIRVHATASVGGAGVWLIIALTAGLGQPVVWWLYVLGGICTCMAWTLRRVARSDGSDIHTDEGGEQILTAVGLAGARFAKAKVEGPKVTARLRLVPGEQTTADAQGAARRLDSRLGLRPGATRVIPNDDDESEPMVEIVARDPLIHPIAWLGPDAPGESIAVQVHFGTYDDGTAAGLWFPGQVKPPRVGAHVKVAGMTGAGKTEAGLIICTNILTRNDASLVYIDPVKGIQSIRPIIGGVDLPIIDRPKALAAMKKLPDLIRARTQWLGEHGFSQWEPGCGLKYLIWWIEESADLIADSTTFTKVTEQARSAGISLVASQQRWSHDRVDTSARANFGAGLCFGVDNEDSAEMVLTRDTIDAGASPWRWQNTKPGYFYLGAPGIDPRRWPSPGRSDLAEADHLTDAVAEFAHPGLDYVTAIVLGTLYSDHTSMVAEGKAPWQKPPTTATKMPAAPVVDLADESEDLVDDEDNTDEDAETYEHTVPAQPEPGFMDDINPALDIPDDDDEVIPLGVPAPQIKPGRAEAVAALEKELRERAAAGQETISTADLVELRQRIGRVPSWLSAELARLVDEGLLEEHPDRGVYGLPVSVAA